MQLKLKQGRGIEILIAHKNDFFSLSQCIISIFVKVKQLSEWEEEPCPRWDYSAHRQRVGSVLSCLIPPGLILLLSHPLLLQDHVCFIPTLCMWPWNHELKTRTHFQSARTTVDTQEKRLNTFPPEFKSFCLYSLLQNLSYPRGLHELITCMYKQEEEKVLSHAESDVTILLDF